VHAAAVEDLQDQITAISNENRMLQFLHNSLGLNTEDIPTDD
jgi:hypothetical protein